MDNVEAAGLKPEAVSALFHNRRRPRIRPQIVRPDPVQAPFLEPLPKNRFTNRLLFYNLIALGAVVEFLEKPVDPFDARRGCA